MTDIERLARALANCRDGFTESGTSLVSDYDRDLVRAILAELREPSEGMVKLGFAALNDDRWSERTGTQDLAHAFTKMIDSITEQSA